MVSDIDIAGSRSREPSKLGAAKDLVTPIAETEFNESDVRELTGRFDYDALHEYADEHVHATEGERGHSSAARSRRAARW